MANTERHERAAHYQANAKTAYDCAQTWYNLGEYKFAAEMQVIAADWSYDARVEYRIAELNKDEYLYG